MRIRWSQISEILTLILSLINLITQDLCLSFLKCTLDLYKI